MSKAGTYEVPSASGVTTIVGSAATSGATIALYPPFGSLNESDLGISITATPQLAVPVAAMAEPSHPNEVTPGVALLSSTVDRVVATLGTLPLRRP